MPKLVVRKKKPAKKTSKKKTAVKEDSSDSSSSDVSVLSENYEGPSTGFTCLDDESDNLSLGGVSIGGGDSVDGKSVGGMSTDTNEKLGSAADDLVDRVEAYLADFDGTIEDDPEMVALREALKEAQQSMEKARQKAKEAEEERAADIEAAKSANRACRRQHLQRTESIEELGGIEVEEKRRLVTDSDDEDLNRSGHEIDAMNQRFRDQVGRVRRKNKKREALAAQMKLGAKKAVRKLRHAEIRIRRAKEEADKEKNEKKVNQLDMSEEARRNRVFSCYTQYGMPPKQKFIPLLAKMPKSMGVSADDVDLVPWDEHGRRVNVSTLNKVLAGIKKADW